MVRSADLCVLVVDLGDDDGPFAAEALLDKLAQVKTVLTGEPPAAPEDLTIAYVRTLLAANKSAADGAADRLEIVQEMFAARFPMLTLDAESGRGLEDLRNTIYKALKVIRVYSKRPGKPADTDAPFTIPVGGTVARLAEQVHREVAEKLKSARVWGSSAAFDGQTVTRDHVLHDKDVVELHV
jgi:ribosome-interacting GTPase 1